VDGGNKLPAIVSVYICVVVGGAVAVMAGYLLSARSGWPDPSCSSTELVVVGILFALAGFFAELFPVEIPSPRIFDDNGDRVALSSAVYIASLLLYGPAFTVLIAGISVMGAELWKRKGARKVAFNAGQYVLTVGISGLFLLITGTNPHSFAPFVSSPQGMLVLPATLASYLLLNTSLVSAILAMVKGSSFLDQWRQDSWEILPTYLGMLNVGTIAALLWTVSPVAIVLLPLPLLALQVAFKATAQLKEETLRALIGIAEMVDSRDSYAYRHSIDVARFATQTATKLGLSLNEVDTINLSALLHDIGKIGTPDRVLHKPAALTEDERAVMQLHPSEGAKVLQYFSLFKPGVDLVLYHQEHFDGSGYPRGLAGEQIPLGARIIHVADAYQAMISDRVYRKGLDSNVAVGRLLADAGKQFDPDVVKAFIEVLQDSRVPLDPRLVGANAPPSVGERKELEDVLVAGGSDRPDPGHSRA
jgi:putative nucleotidyltransferase with HDIG domain